MATQAIVPVSVPKSVAIVGRATFTMLASRPSMSETSATTTSNKAMPLFPLMVCVMFHMIEK
jgi:hypothetical protein